MTRERAREKFIDYQKLKIEFIHERKEYMAPAASWHNRNGYNIQAIFINYIESKQLPHIVFADSLRVYYNSGNNYVMPDIAIVADPSEVQNDRIHTAPDLVIEILSPSTRETDMAEKSDVYGLFGVPEYWTVNVKEKTVTVWKNVGNQLKITKVYEFPPKDYDPDIDDHIYQTKFHTLLFGDNLTIDLNDVFRGL
ncbi:MAG: Uma2 family endonuclease [Oscillospiraceae bacterium]|nr:Uma2 family endonuclease [Oscillospiraceae bacterium]